LDFADFYLSPEDLKQLNETLVEFESQGDFDNASRQKEERILVLAKTLI